jgi:hypothetical protein
MSMLDFYIRVTKALDDIGAPYMIVGAFGGTIFGITRATNDVDIIVDLHDKDFEALSQKFPLPRYYADPEMIRNSVLYFCLRGYSNYDINLDEVTKEAAHIGRETLEMWNKTLAKAKEEVEKGDVPRKW